MIPTKLCQEYAVAALKIPLVPLESQIACQNKWTYVPTIQRKNCPESADAAFPMNPTLKQERQYA
jgi:hypothetical protein